MNERRIDLNAATAEELTQLPGIGPVLAERIAAYRDTVRFFEEPAQLTAVSGIGESTYRAIADRLAVTAPEELSRPAVETPPREIEEMGETAAQPAPEEKALSEAEAPAEEATSPEEEIELELQEVPPGEAMPEQELDFAEEAGEEDASETAPQTEHLPEEAIEQAPPEASEGPEEVTGGEEEAEEAPPEAQEMPTEEEVAPEVEEVPAEEVSDAEAVPPELGLPAAQVEERPEPAPSPSWWRRLSWLWTALLGGLLGMVFALAVFSGVNGSLDVGHSRAVVDVRGRMDSLATDVNSLQGDVDGLRKRLDALEELTVRMDKVEASVGDLQKATVDLDERADALEEHVDAVVAELEAVSEQVAALQDQAEQTQSFFQGLQTLLNDIFGEVEGESTVAPTPTPEGK